MNGKLGAVLAIGLLAALIGCSSKEKTESAAGLSYQWGPKHVCLPCHEQRSPIARNHNYYCTACHAGVAYATDKDVAHRGLFAKPQAPGFIEKACHQCHQKTVGKEVPYDADFVRDVLISHGDYARNTNIPETYDKKKFRDIDEKFRPQEGGAPIPGGAAPAPAPDKAAPAPAPAPKQETAPAPSDDEFFDDFGGDSGGGKATEGGKGGGKDEFDEDFFMDEE